MLHKKTDNFNDFSRYYSEENQELLEKKNNHSPYLTSLLLLFLIALSYFAYTHFAHKKSEKALHEKENQITLPSSPQITSMKEEKSIESDATIKKRALIAKLVIEKIEEQKIQKKRLQEKRLQKEKFQEERRKEAVKKEQEREERAKKEKIEEERLAQKKTLQEKLKKKHTPSRHPQKKKHTKSIKNTSIKKKKRIASPKQNTKPIHRVERESTEENPLPKVTYYEERPPLQPISRDSDTKILNHLSLELENMLHKKSP